MKMRIDRRSFLSRMAQGAGLAAFPRLLAAAGTRPNILYIMSDDHATSAISAYGSARNRTPNIDRIASEGMRLTNCFCVDSICTPSRGAILTGKYGHITGIRNLGDRLDTGIMTFPRLLQRAGYQTAIVGKWHLSGSDIKNPPMGFDYWKVLPGQGKYDDPEMFDMGERKQHYGYATDLITDFSLDFLERRDRNKPFLMMVHNKAPHGPWKYDDKHERMYEGQTIPEPPTLWDDYRNRSSAIRDSGRTIADLAQRMSAPNWDTGPLDIKGLDPKHAKAAAYQKYLKDYLRCVASVDDNVGRLLAYLDQERLAENTIVIYTSDQGMFLGEHGFMDKRLMYEDSLRMPFLVRYPGVIEAGGVCDRMVLNVDFAETILDFSGAPIPDDMQGRSFRPILEGKEPKDWRTSMFYRYYMPGTSPPHYGVRSERYKLIYYTDTAEWELFDLQKDPLEMNSVYNRPEYGEDVKQMKTELRRLCRELKVTSEELAPTAERQKSTKGQRGK